MAIDDDPLRIKAKQIANESSEPNLLNIAENIRNTILNLTLPAHLGEVLTGLVGVASQARWNARVSELLTDFAERMSRLSEDAVVKGYYSSEEFQAILIEAVDQERTNRFILKRRMLAAGLARSGTKAHADDLDKETYFRVLRDLSPTDLALLGQFRQATSGYDPTSAQQVPMTTVHDLAPPQDSIVRRLEGLGLVRSSIEVMEDLSHVRFDEMSQAVDYAYRLSRATRVLSFQISTFGLRFLEFLKD